MKTKLLIGVIIMFLTINIVSAPSPGVPYTITVNWIYAIDRLFLISLPTNTTYDSSEIRLNITQLNESIDAFWYSLDEGSNITFSPNITIKNVGWEAYHDVTVWANTSDTEQWEIRRFYIGIEEEFWIWIDLFLIFFILLVSGVVWKNYFFVFAAGSLMLLMGIWVMNEGITVYAVSEWWIYPLGWIMVGIGILLSVASSIELIRDMGGESEWS